MFLRGLLVAVVFLAVGGTVQADTKRQSEFTVGAWVGQASRAPDGSVTFCAATKVGGGNALILGLSSADELEVGVFKLAWRLPVGDAYDIAISVDGQEIGRFRTVVAFAKMIRVPLGRNPGAYERLRKGDLLHIAMAQEYLTFDLDGADEALAAIRDCVGAAD